MPYVVYLIKTKISGVKIKMKERLISLIIPCYNVAKTLPRTLNSVREQSYKNLEIIIVNDGSKDNTLEVATKYATIDPRIRLITQDNSGVSVARNNGLRNANGEYIMFLDADDNYTTPYAISNMMKKLQETGADMCVCNFIHPCFEEYLESGVYDLTDRSQLLTYFQDFFVYGMPWNKIAKRECYTEDFAVGIHFNEDELFNLDNLHNIKKVAVINEVYHNYYCAPYNPNEKASAVNSIYSADKFWEKKSTIWHMGMKNHEYRVHSIEKFYPALKTEMQYVRSFDFFFWDFFLMAKNRVPEECIAYTCKGIFAEKLFLDTITDKARYGLKLKDYTDSDIETFVRLAYYAFRDIKSYNKKLSMYKVFLGLFGKIFYDLTERVNDLDILAKTYLSLKDNSSAEAIYVNSLFEIEEIENDQNNCRIILFDNNMASWSGVKELN